MPSRPNHPRPKIRRLLLEVPHRPVSDGDARQLPPCPAGRMTTSGIGSPSKAMCIGHSSTTSKSGWQGGLETTTPRTRYARCSGLCGIFSMILPWISSSRAGSSKNPPQPPGRICQRSSGTRRQLSFHRFFKVTFIITLINTNEKIKREWPSPNFLSMDSISQHKIGCEVQVVSLDTHVCQGQLDFRICEPAKSIGIINLEGGSLRSR